MNNDIEFLKRQVAAQDETIGQWIEMYDRSRAENQRLSSRLNWAVFCNLVFIIALICAI